MDKRREPLFSVIVSVYKVEQYLHQCVDSILSQTFSDFEVILVDDGSPDHCGAICDEYARKDSRVKVIHKENGGPAKARWAGYSICTGSYILNVDSDDYIDADLLAKVEEKIRTYSVDAVLFGFDRFGEGMDECHPQGIASGLYAGEKMEIVRDNLILGADGGPAVHCNLCALAIQKDRIEPYFAAFPQTICRGEDLIVTVPALAHCNSVYVLEETPYHYRNTPGSLMNSHRGNELDQALVLAEYLEEKLGKRYHLKLANYVLKECYDHLRHYRDSWKRYHTEVRRVRDVRLLKHLQAAKCSKNTILPEKIVFFLLGHRMFNLLWLIWKIKG